MAQLKVVDLVVVQHGQQAPARTGEGSLALAKISAPWGTLVGSGAALVGVGVIALTILPISLFGLLFTNLLFSAGAFLAVLGLARRWSMTGRPTPSPAPRIDPHVLAERCRRVRALLQGGEGIYTFERLVRESRWTQAAMLSTLLHMKERGEIVEDLNLDSGEWVYTLAEAPEGPTAATSPMLEERQALGHDAERQG